MPYPQCVDHELTNVKKVYKKVKVVKRGGDVFVEKALTVDTGTTMLQEGSDVILLGVHIDILKELIVAETDVNLGSQHRRPNLQTVNVTPISNTVADGDAFFASTIDKGYVYFYRVGRDSCFTDVGETSENTMSLQDSIVSTKHGHVLQIQFNTRCFHIIQESRNASRFFSKFNDL
jgi:hypothetical protein